MKKEEALRKLQLEALDILKEFDEYCSKYEITWFLLSGTALGAVRHGGYIPWDDDLDVGMLREDYERLITCAKEYFPEGYTLDVPGEKLELAPLFAKMCKKNTSFITQETLEAGYDQGIFLDIIPLDRIARNEKQRTAQLRNSYFWQSVSYLWHAGTIHVPHQGILGSIEKTGCRIAHHLVKAFVSPQIILERYKRSILDEEQASDEWILLSWPHTKPFPTEVLVPVTYRVFEGIEFPVPGKPEAYLELMYGDWQTLPPIEKRHTHMPLKIVFSDGSSWSAQ